MLSLSLSLSLSLPRYHVYLNGKAKLQLMVKVLGSSLMAKEQVRDCSLSVACISMAGEVGLTAEAQIVVFVGLSWEMR